MHHIRRYHDQGTSRSNGRIAALIILSLAFLPACDNAVDAELTEQATPVELTEPADGAETANAILFRWSGSRPIEGFQVQVAMDPSFTELVTDANVGSLTRHIVRDLKRDRIYYWRVRGANVNAQDDWSPVRSFTPVRIAQLPGKPALRAPADLAGPLPREVTVEWESVPRAISYHLEVFMDEDLLLYQTDLDNLTSTRFSMTDLVYTYPYWWRVRAQSVAGYGAWSNVWKFQIEDGE